MLNPDPLTPPGTHTANRLLDGSRVADVHIQAYLIDTLGLRFEGEWNQPQLSSLMRALGVIAQALRNHTSQPAVAWMQAYLGSTCFNHGMLLRRYYYVWRSKMHLGKGFSINTVIHEFGHILDNRIASKNASVCGGGPADALFRAVGGNPEIGWLRFMNGAQSKPYRNDVGAMASLPQSARFPVGRYGNHSTADYFAETWAALMLNTRQAPPVALAWMAAFIARLA